MGRVPRIDRRPFRDAELHDKELVVKMLRREEEIIRSDEGQDRYRNKLTLPGVSLTNEYAFNRMVLAEFGFDTSDESVDYYRSIFRTYFHSPSSYDKDVINAVHYFRANRCVFYTAPKIRVGDCIPEVPLYMLNGEDKVSLHEVVRKDAPAYTLLCAFSMS